jgi:hypothetical protein
MHVVAVNQALAYESGRTNFADVSMVALAVDQEEAILLSLAEKRGCTMKLLLRRDGKPKDSEYNMEEIKKLLQDDQKPAVIRDTEDRNGAQGTEVPPSVTPALPVVENDMVKVWIAKENIPANTTLTGDLVAAKFSQVERPKEYAEDACPDLGEYFTKALVYGIAKGQYVTYSMVGDQRLKLSPQDLNIVGIPKPGPVEPSTAGPETPKNPVVVRPTVAPEVHDVSVHTATGTQIHRFMKVRGSWKQIGVLTPAQAAQHVNHPAASDKPAGSDVPPANPEGSVKQ